MIKKTLLLTFIFCALVSAHGVLLLIEDNGDGTIYIEAGLSTGGSAEGADVVVKEKASGRPIFEGKIPAEGKFNTLQPSVPYTVTVSMGEGHSVTKNGPLANEKKSSSGKKEHVHGPSCKH